MFIIKYLVSLILYEECLKNKLEERAPAAPTKCGVKLRSHLRQESAPKKQSTELQPRGACGASCG